MEYKHQTEYCLRENLPLEVGYTLKKKEFGYSDLEINDNILFLKLSGYMDFCFIVIIYPYTYCIIIYFFIYLQIKE